MVDYYNYKSRVYIRLTAEYLCDKQNQNSKRFDLDLPLAKIMLNRLQTRFPIMKHILNTMKVSIEANLSTTFDFCFETNKKGKNIERIGKTAVHSFQRLISTHNS